MENEDDAMGEMTMDELRGWFAGRIPDEWFTGRSR